MSDRRWIQQYKTVSEARSRLFVNSIRGNAEASRRMCQQSDDSTLRTLLLGCAVGHGFGLIQWLGLSIRSMDHYVCQDATSHGRYWSQIRSSLSLSHGSKFSMGNPILKNLSPNNRQAFPRSFGSNKKPPLSKLCGNGTRVKIIKQMLYFFLGCLCCGGSKPELINRRVFIDTCCMTTYNIG